MDMLTALVTMTLIALAAGEEPAASTTITTTNLTLHNLCPYPVWPLVTQNIGLPAIAGEDVAGGVRLEGNGDGLASLTFPAGEWSGRVVARTSCVAAAGGPVAGTLNCETGDAPPVTVAQVSVNGAAGLAEYSVSLVDGFNVPAVVTPHGFEQGRQCPSLGCAADLAGGECPGDARAPGGGCRSSARAAQLFKERCPDARTTATDVEATPQRCLEPGELKVVFCPSRSNQTN